MLAIACRGRRCLLITEEDRNGNRHGAYRFVSIVGGTTCWERINANYASIASRSFPCLPRHVYQSQLHVDGKLKCKNCNCTV